MNPQNLKITVSGTIVEIKQPETYGNSQKQEFVVLVQNFSNGQTYEETILCEAKGRAMETLMYTQVGSAITANGALSGRKWVAPDGETKYFHSVRIWNITNAQQQQFNQQPQQQQFAAQGYAQTGAMQPPAHGQVQQQQPVYNQNPNGANPNNPTTPQAPPPQATGYNQPTQQPGQQSFNVPPNQQAFDANGQPIPF